MPWQWFSWAEGGGAWVWHCTGETDYEDHVWLGGVWYQYYHNQQHSLGRAFLQEPEGGKIWHVVWPPGGMWGQDNMWLQRNWLQQWQQ
jgi:hypothetical protein